MGWGIVGVSNLDEGLSPKSLGSSSLSPFLPLSCGLFAECLHNEISFKLAVVVPTTGGNVFHSTSNFSIIFSFFSFGNFEMETSFRAFIIDQPIDNSMMYYLGDLESPKGQSILIMIPAGKCPAAQSLQGIFNFLTVVTAASLYCDDQWLGRSFL
jgi:hypothetical protein